MQKILNLKLNIANSKDSLAYKKKSSIKASFYEMKIIFETFEHLLTIIELANEDFYKGNL